MIIHEKQELQTITVMSTDLQNVLFGAVQALRKYKVVDSLVHDITIHPEIESDQWWLVIYYEENPNEISG